MLVDPFKPTLKVPGTDLLKLKSEELLSNFAFRSNLRRYSMARRGELLPQTVGQAQGWVDPWSESGRSDLYGFAKKAMFDIGVDALWAGAYTRQLLSST